MVKNKNKNKNNNECSICFENITASTGKTILSCSHNFHLKCIVDWFQHEHSNQQCPYCRHIPSDLEHVDQTETVEVFIPIPPNQSFARREFRRGILIGSCVTILVFLTPFMPSLF
jgi:hypothetical protein